MTRTATTPAIVPSPNAFDFDHASLRLFSRLRRPVPARRGAYPVTTAAPAGLDDRSADSDHADCVAGSARLAA